MFLLNKFIYLVDRIVSTVFNKILSSIKCKLILSSLSCVNFINMCSANLLYLFTLILSIVYFPIRSDNFVEYKLSHVNFTNVHSSKLFYLLPQICPLCPFPIRSDNFVEYKLSHSSLLSALSSMANVLRHLP